MGKKLFLVSLLSLCLVFAAGAASAEEGIITLTEMTGKVMVKVHPSMEWTEAKVGQIIHKKDFVKTDTDGKTMLEFPNKTSVTLKPKTEISVDELIWDNTTRKVNLNMTSGELKTVLNKVDTPSEFKIKTPTAICGARGTVFYVVVFADGTGVYVEQGLVEFLNTVSGQSYTVYEGMNSNTHTDGTISQPQPLSKEEVTKIIADYDMKPVAEPYTPPVEPAGKGDTNPPDVIQENPASGT